MPILHAKDTGDSASEMEALYDREDETEGGDTGSEESGKTEVKPPTDLLDKKLLMGKTVKPGDRIILEVVAVNGDGVEVRYPEEQEEEPQMSEDDQLAKLSS